MLRQAMPEPIHGQEAFRLVARKAFVEILGLPPDRPDLLGRGFALEELGNQDRRIGQLTPEARIAGRFVTIGPILLGEERLQMLDGIEAANCRTDRARARLLSVQRLRWP